MVDISAYFTKVKTWCGDDIPLETGLSVALNYLKTPNSFLHIAALACAKEEGLKTLAGLTFGVVAHGVYSKLKAESVLAIVADPSLPSTSGSSPASASSKPTSFLEWIGALAQDNEDTQAKMMAKIIFVAAIILIQLFKGDFLHLKMISALALGALEGQHLLIKLQDGKEKPMDDKEKPMNSID